MVASVGVDLKGALKFPSNAAEQVGETAVSEEAVDNFFYHHAESITEVLLLLKYLNLFNILHIARQLLVLLNT